MTLDWILFFDEADAASERYQIWKTTVPEKAILAEDIDLTLIADKYELNGSSIVSVIHHASLQTISRGNWNILKKDLLEGIKREYEKEEKVFLGSFMQFYRCLLGLINLTE